MMDLESPVFCLTSDADWASEYCIEDFLAFTRSHGITPTVFATHQSAALERAAVASLAERGMHPNFLPHSTHGADRLAVIEHMFQLFPDAECFRAHCFADDTHITREFRRRGIRYDSNLCLYLQPGLIPLRHASGLTRFPVFWEDDVHWRLSGGDWTLRKHLRSFLTPGLKILNVHPFFFAANIPSGSYYQGIKRWIPTVDEASIRQVRFAGRGSRDFVVELIEALEREGLRFWTLAELYEVSCDVRPTSQAVMRRVR